MSAQQRPVESTPSGQVVPNVGSPAWGAEAQAMFRAAQAVSHAGGPSLFADLVRELAQTLQAAAAFVAVFTDDGRDRMRMLAAVLDGKLLRNFDYRLQGSPCAKVVGRAFRYEVQGIAAELAPGTMFAAKGMDSYAAIPLNDSAGAPLGLLVAMDRKPIADATLAEALLKIFAGRIVAEIERDRADEAFRSAALAVSSARADAVFAELVRHLAAMLHCEVAFIARQPPGQPHLLSMLAMVEDGQVQCDFSYAVAGTPCETVLGQGFRVYSDDLPRRFPDDLDAQTQGLQAYAGFPLTALDGTPLGVVAVGSRRPLQHLDRIEATLNIFALRAAAEIERLAASEALQRSEASYRAIFEAAEDAIFVHDWDSGEVLDVNPKACESYGCSYAQRSLITLANLDTGVEPYTAAAALRHIRAAKLGNCPPFEWLRRSADGSAHWDEVRLKPVQIGGRQHILAYSRDITAQKHALEAVRAREEQYRVIFDGSADALALWDAELRIVDINQAFTRLFGFTREEMIGQSWGDRLDAEAIEQRVRMFRAALDGQEGSMETESVRRDGSRFQIELRCLPIGYAGAPHVLAVGRDITDRKAALAALQAQEQKYRAIFDGSVDSMVLWDDRLHVVDVNEAFVRMTGLARHEVIGKHWRERPDAQDMQHLLELIRAALQGRINQVTTTVTRADGSPFEAELRYLPMCLGERSYALGVGRDVSERLEQERALQRSEAQYRDIFNASADALVLRDADFCIIDVNATYETMSGYSRDEVLGVDRIIANPAEVAPAIREKHARALDGEPFAIEVPLLRRDGACYQIELRGVPILHRGAPHVLYMGRDVTANKRAEAALRDSEEQYRAIFNASADGLVLRDEEYRAVDVNPAYLAMSGYSREEVLNARRALTQVDPAIQQEHFAQHARILAGEHVRFEVVGTRKNGSQFQIEVNAMPLLYRGEPHALYAARDISERREAETQRAELERQLRQAQKMEAIGQLTGGIAHDFNNILTSVIGYLVLGLERAEVLGDPKLQRQLGQAHLAAQRARELIAQMLAFARRQRGERRPLSLAPLVSQTLQLLRATLPSSLTLDFQATAGDDETQVSADAVQLEQVLFNLCINARDAIQGPGSIRVRLGLHGGAWRCASCRAAGHAQRWVALSVADSGSGIDGDLLERIFEPFVSSKEVGRGSGMGLAMVHGIVHDHGGHVSVATMHGAGSVFQLLLPPAPALLSAVPPAELPKSATTPALCGRVMVVDDEAMVGEFMAERIDGWGIEVVLQRDPSQALAWLQDPANEVDLLITDQTMPQLSGLELAQRATALRPGLPVLLYSGNAEGFDAAEVQRHGVCAVLRKPVDAEVLRAALQRCLARRTQGTPPH